MSWNPALDPDCPIGDDVDRIETVIVPRARDLGGQGIGATGVANCRPEMIRTLSRFRGNRPPAQVL